MLPETRVLLSLWRSLGQGAVPRRALFSPFQIPALLPYLFVLDVADRVEDYRFRLAGSALEGAYGVEVTGLTIGEIDLGQGQPRERLQRDYATCTRDGVAALSRQTFKVETSGPYFHERLLLPFETVKPGHVGQIVGGIFFDPKYKGLTWKKAITGWREDSNEIFHPSATAPASGLGSSRLRQHHD